MERRRFGFASSISVWHRPLPHGKADCGLAEKGLCRPLPKTCLHTQGGMRGCTFPESLPHTGTGTVCSVGSVACIKKLRNVQLFRQRQIRRPIRSRYANIRKYTTVMLLGLSDEIAFVIQPGKTRQKAGRQRGI